MPSTPNTKFPGLPGEVARLILQHLNFKEICNALSSGDKAFWEWGNALVFIEGPKTPSQLSFASLQQFQARRARLGLKVFPEPV